MLHTSANRAQGRALRWSGPFGVGTARWVPRAGAPGDAPNPAHGRTGLATKLRGGKKKKKKKIILVLLQSSVFLVLLLLLLLLPPPPPPRPIRSSTYGLTGCLHMALPSPISTYASQ
ncbi:unnamed protein product [Prorocentrum cordatum]|uniref:Uncharacterized protein n=1 Tax=Prorocentrum cordatum TaxID=2364126 RepID=A0ABN9RWT0_9DINO|nr:unnamed protein product [Polarella glacialis]